ncbi:MAG: hypothetical protein WAM47_07300 [Candidatus Sulfotelmatobacter sp.]
MAEAAVRRNLSCVIALLFASLLAHAQTLTPGQGAASGGSGVSITTVSGLSSVSGKTKGTIAVVTDGTSSSDCSTGGSSTVVTCQYSGSSWSQLTASGGAAPTNLGAITYNASGTSIFAAASATVVIGKLTATHSTSTTLSPTGLVAGGTYTLEIIQDATGGGVTVTLGTGGTCSAWKVLGGGSGAIVLSTAPSVIDVLQWTYDGTNCIASFANNAN